MPHMLPDTLVFWRPLSWWARRQLTGDLVCISLASDVGHLSMGLWTFRVSGETRYSSPLPVLSLGSLHILGPGPSDRICKHFTPSRGLPFLSVDGFHSLIRISWASFRARPFEPTCPWLWATHESPSTAPRPPWDPGPACRPAGSIEAAVLPRLDLPEKRQQPPPNQTPSSRGPPACRAAAARTGRGGGGPEVGRGRRGSAGR